MKGKQIFLFVVLLLAVFGLSKVRFLAIDDGLEMFASIMNSGSNDIDDVRVIAYMPEIGEIIRSNTFDIDDGENYEKIMLWDRLPKGEHLVRVVASNDKHRSVKYRYVFIE
ncbi:MAG: hypothetical protein KAU20_03385 [Nanoarchaeota archaeon]|nr:hypothetical protein [Nanoarchaeota archaeon]